MISYHYAYLELSLTFLLVWTIFFLLRKDLRKEILFVSLVSLPMGPAHELMLFFADYWRPEIFTPTYLGIEDAIYAFSIGGIAATIYYVFFKKKYSEKISKGYPFYLSLFFIAGLPLILFANKVLGVNSVYLVSAFLILISAIMLWLRSDLWWSALCSAVLFLILFLLLYIPWMRLYPNVFNNWWMAKNVSGVRLLGIPSEEFLWAFSWGLASGMFFKFIRGVRAK